jgi:MFS family permease
MMAVAGAAATLTLTGLIRPWHIFVFGAVGGLVRALEGPARQTLVLQMVGRGELPNAVALTSSLMSAGRVIGPAVGGVVVAAVGVGYCYAINAVTFLPVLAALLLLRRAEFYPLRRSGRPALVRGVGEVVRHARTTPAVLVVVVSVFLLSLFSANVNVLVPALADETVAGDAAVFGALMAALGLGSTAGALFAASLGRASRRAFVVGGAGMGLAELLVAVRPTVASGAVLLFAAGACYMLWTSNGASILQLSAPDNLQGRVAALYMFAFIGVSPFGGLLSGALAASGGVLLAYGVGGAMGLSVGLGAAYMLRRLQLVRPPRPQPAPGRA